MGGSGLQRAGEAEGRQMSRREVECVLGRQAGRGSGIKKHPIVVMNKPDLFITTGAVLAQA